MRCLICYAPSQKFFLSENAVLFRNYWAGMYLKQPVGDIWLFKPLPFYDDLCTKLGLKKTFSTLNYHNLKKMQNNKIRWQVYADTYVGYFKLTQDSQ